MELLERNRDLVMALTQLATLGVLAATLLFLWRSAVSSHRAADATRKGVRLAALSRVHADLGRIRPERLRLRELVLKQRAGKTLTQDEATAIRDLAGAVSTHYDFLGHLYYLGLLEDADVFDLLAESIVYTWGLCEQGVAELRSNGQPARARHSFQLLALDAEIWLEQHPHDSVPRSRAKYEAERRRGRRPCT